MQAIYFTVMGLLGAVAYILVNSDECKDLTQFDSYKRLALGAISGFIYNILYSDYSFPNSIMCFVSGYMGTTFIVALTKRLVPPSG